MCEALDDHEKTAYYQLLLCRLHCRKCRKERSWRLGRTSQRNHYKVQNGETKLMTNNPNGFQSEIKIKGQRLEAVKNLKYPLLIISMKVQNLRFLWQQLFLDWRAYRETRTSGLFLKLSWCGRSSYIPSFIPLRAGLWQPNSIQSLEMRCCRRLLNISDKDHVTNDKVSSRIQDTTSGSAV